SAAQATADRLFGIVRGTILDFFALTAEGRSALVDLHPVDTSTLWQEIHGHFLGPEDPALLPAPGERYPRLEWRDTITNVVVVADELNVTTASEMTLLCA